MGLWGHHRNFNVQRDGSKMSAGGLFRVVSRALPLLSMPDFLRALGHTSVLFWRDREPPTWGQAAFLFLNLSGFISMAQFGYAGDGPRVGIVGLSYGLGFLVSIALVFSGPKLGPAFRFGPALVRLIGIALVFGSAAIALNGLYPWANSVPPLPGYLGRTRGAVCLVSGTVATLLLVVRTVRNGRTEVFGRGVELALSSVFLLLVTTLFLYWGVIPHRTVRML